METAGTSTSSEKDRMEAGEEAVKIIALGKRNLVCGEIPNAVNQFQEACRVLAKAYGETAKECAEAYFYYGQALLDLARMENGVLGNALKGADAALDEEEEGEKSSDEQFEKADNLDGEEREKLRKEVYDAMAEDGKMEEEKTDSKEGKEEKKEKQGEEAMETSKDESTEKEKEKESTEKEKEKESKNEEKKDEDKNEEKKDEDKNEEKTEEDDAAEGEEEEGEEEEGGEEEGEDTAADTAEETENSQDEGEESGEKKENPDDISNLQLAWEMLELAKIIYLKDEAKEAKLKAAESFLKLGEVSLETEQYEQAVSDFKECLKIQEQILEPEDRLLAETHYQLGLAYGFDKKYDDSIAHYRKAIEGIEDKIAKLSKIVEANAESKDKGKEPAAKDDPVKSADQEIKELQEILPDIRGKVEDMEEEKKNIDELKNIAKEAIGGLAGSTTELSKPDDASETKKASDISHLVRRKRKPDEDDGGETDSKKTKQEEGSGDASAKQNGISKSPSKPMDVEEQKKIEAEANQPKEAVAS